MLSGPWLTPLAVPVRPGQCFGGVRIQPGALHGVLGLDPREMRDRIIPVPASLEAIVTSLRLELGPRPGADEMAAALDRNLPTLVAHRPGRDPLIAAATDRLIASGGELPIAELARELGCSERTLRRRFVAATGQSPKEFARIRRLLKAAWTVALEGRTWSEAAHAAGYADQPHLHRDVADFTGLTPGALGRRIRSTSHDDVVP
jgi:AraC-like DNA-binding protein